MKRKLNLLETLAWLLLAAIFVFLLTCSLTEAQELKTENTELSTENESLKEKSLELQFKNQELLRQIEDLKNIIEQDKLEKSNRSGERKMISLGEYTVTAYCSCEKCCGKWALNRPGGKVYGASGNELTPNLSVASPLPFGTEIYIDGQKYIVQDRTAGWVAERYNGRIIDLYMSTHAEAKKWGKQIKEIFVMEDCYGQLNEND